jgi:hypothetical protein
MAMSGESPSAAASADMLSTDGSCFSAKEILMHVLALLVLILTLGAAPPTRAQTYDPTYPACQQIYQGWNAY